MNISLRDRLLRNQINQMENEYNNIIKNLYDSKIQFLKRNHPNNFSSFTYFNKYNYSPYNDIDLQNRITNSLYASKNKNIFTPKYSISQSSTTNAGHTETDFLRHSSLDVEKVARTAFELAEEKHLNIIELHYATRYYSSYLWTRIIEDIAPDYQYESMIHVSLPIFIVTHEAYTVHNNLILVDPYFKEIALVLALHDGYKIVSNVSSGRSYLTLEVK